MNLKKIILAIKPWERGLPVAVQHARFLARVDEAQLQLVTSVFDAGVGAACDRGDESARRIRGRTIDATLAVLERLAVPLRQSGVPVTTRVAWGAPAYQVILDAAEGWDANLVVVGAHDRATRHARLTDTDWQLLQRTSRPLLLVKSASFSAYEPILTAVDAPHAHNVSDGVDHEALAAARRLAHAFGSKLCECDLLDSREGQAVVDVAARHEARLLVVGAAQGRGAADAIRAHTVERVAGDVECDVLIVPARQAPLAYSKVG
jgi:nucleotide-binding universal stress UspA family protein